MEYSRTEPLCSKLPTAQSYRLQKINEIQKEIERERDKRTALSTKYRKSIRMLCSSGLATLCTVIAAPSIAIATGTGGQVSKKLALKAAKHEKIKAEAEAKLNTISNLISKALIDDSISDEEYSLILSELLKFNVLKEETKRKIKVNIEELTRQMTF